MVDEMKKVAKMVHDQELSVEERNLLSVAYKNVIGARRASWRIISSIEQKEEGKGNEEHVASIKGYRQVVSSGPHPARGDRGLAATQGAAARRAARARGVGRHSAAPLDAVVRPAGGWRARRSGLLCCWGWGF
jgi:hypothetical protein